jgi:hypothetical protein
MTKQHEFTLEEKLALENLRLKIQMAELQKQSATQQLNTYSRGLVQKYEVPDGAQVSFTDTHLIVQDTPAPLADERTSEKALSQADVERQEQADKAA